jgi:hypothetical protein
MSSRASRKRAYRAEQGVAALFAFGCSCGAKLDGAVADFQGLDANVAPRMFAAMHGQCGEHLESPDGYVPREGGDWPPMLEIVSVDLERKRIGIAGAGVG